MQNKIKRIKEIISNLSLEDFRIMWLCHLIKNSYTHRKIDLLRMIDDIMRYQKQIFLVFYKIVHKTIQRINRIN